MPFASRFIIISCTLLALFGPSKASPFPATSTEPSESEASKDKPQPYTTEQDITPLLEVAQYPVQEVADFVTTNRSRQDGRHVLLLLSPESEWERFFRAVKIEISRCGMPKWPLGKVPRIVAVGSPRSWQEYDATQLDVIPSRFRGRRPTEILTSRPLKEDWFKDRIKEKHFPDPVSWETKVKLKDWDMVSLNYGFDWIWILKNLDRDLSSSQALASVLRNVDIKTEHTAKNLKRQDRLRDMTFILALNVTAPKWTEDKDTGNPVLEFSNERRKELMDQVKGKVHPDVLKYVSKALIATTGPASGLKVVAHSRF